MKFAKLGWAVKWISGPDNVDAKLVEHFIWPVSWTKDLACHGRHPVFFNTRKAAVEWRNLHYSYIRERADLRAYPHSWRLPRVVRVTLTMQETQREPASNPTTATRKGRAKDRTVRRSAGRDKKSNRRVH